MNEMTLYWIWLQLCLGSGAKVDESVAYFENPKAIYDAGDTQRVYSNAFTSNQLKKLKTKTLEDAEKVLIECEKTGCGIITPDNEKYPRKLMCMTNYPLVLYTLGDLNCLKGREAISIVGTRRASDSGLDIAGKLSASLCRAGVTVVSGGAFGIDSAAHLGALSEKGKTVAVLGCGFNAKYRDGITGFRQDIIENGAIISEYHPSVEAKGTNFPIRNRIIAALSLGTVVVEAATKSGSLITANLALDYGRDVFAVPGNAANLVQMGTISLIRDGATPVFSSLDILGQYAFTHPDTIDWEKVESDLLYHNHEQIDFSKIKYEVKRVIGGKNDVPIDKREYKDIIPETDKQYFEEKKININISPDAQKVLDVFGDGPVTIDEITEQTSLTMPKILVALTQLEISGIIKSQPGHIYLKK